MDGALMSGARRILALAALVALIACANEAPASRPAVDPNAGAGIDSLNAKLSAVYRARDSRAYPLLFTDSAVFEWPAFNTVRGRPGLETLARDGWKPLDDLALKVIPSKRFIAADHATEFGAFEESWRDSTGARKVEYGRYAEVLARQPDGSWLIDHYFGFEDSTATRPRP
jgi:ketosteroid isomerase-like protein